MPQLSMLLTGIEVSNIKRRKRFDVQPSVFRESQRHNPESKNLSVSSFVFYVFHEPLLWLMRIIKYARRNLS